MKKMFTAMIMLAWFWGAAPCLSAKPVMGTTIEEAVTKAPVILLTEVVGYQFDDLKPGETVKTSARFFLARKYKILEILRDKTNKVAREQVLQIAGKSNTCLVWEEEVSREGNTLRFTRQEKGQAPIEETLTISVGDKFVLFLDEEFSHYGWFVSPAKPEESLLEKIKTGSGCGPQGSR